MAEGFFFFPMERTESGDASGRPGCVGGKVALLGSYLVDTACHELQYAHESVGGERKREGIGGGRRVLQTPSVCRS